MRYEIPNTQYATRCTLNAVVLSTNVENSLQINPFYAKQTQFWKWQKNISTIITMRYANLDTLMGQKTKPKQTQLKPIQTQYKANKAKNKPNSNPIKANYQIPQGGGWANNVSFAFLC
jgi:hypothetical protein